jgi:hypothetical protein
VSFASPAIGARLASASYRLHCPFQKLTPERDYG